MRRLCWYEFAAIFALIAIGGLLATAWINQIE